jgi:hypothetical protein
MMRKTLLSDIALVVPVLNEEAMIVSKLADLLAYIRSQSQLGSER